MRWHSTRESYRSGEWSRLAIVETALVSSCTLWAAFYFQSFMHILLMSILGWLLLLRTEVSEDRGVTLYDRLLKWAEKYERDSRDACIRGGSSFGIFFGISVVVFAVLLLGPIVIKAVVTVRTFVDHFRLTLSSIPSNWARAVFSLDLTLNLELVPGFEQRILNTPKGGGEDNRTTAAEALADCRYASCFSEVRREGCATSVFGVLALLSIICIYWLCYHKPDDINDRYRLVLVPTYVTLLLSALAMSPLRIILYAVPAIAYRWSLKSTAVAYWPLLFALHSSASTDPLLYRLKAKRDGGWAQTMRFASWSILAIITGKIIFWSVLVKFRDNFPGDVTRFIVDDYLGPRLNGWQLASGVNASMAIVTYWLADYWARRMEEGLPVETSGIVKYLSYTGSIAGVLSVYSIWANVSILIHRTPFLHVPPFGKWWP